MSFRSPCIYYYYNPTMSLRGDGENTVEEEDQGHQRAQHRPRNYIHEEVFRE